MRSPLDQFADRIVSNGEVEEFIVGLLTEKRVSVATVKNAVKRAEEENHAKEFMREYDRYRFTT
jgi:hypothetical protein